MKIKDIEFYLKEAENYAGKNHFNQDGSTFVLVPASELPLQYEQLRQKLAQKNPQSQPPQIPRNWSRIIPQRQNGNESNIPPSQPLCLADINVLCRDRYLVTDLSPDNLAHFPENTLGGAYFQYMNDGRFYEFDKNPMTPDSDIKWLIRLLRQTHDFYHLVTEIYHYDWNGGFLVHNDPQHYTRDMLVLSEEMCIYAFIMGQVRLKAVIPIIAEWANIVIASSEKWLKDAYQLWVDTQNYELVEQFGFANFIGDCEKFMYASFKLGCLDTEICVDEYLEELHQILEPLPSNATSEEREYRDMLLESFERGLRSKPLICCQWDRYLANTLQEVREFLNIPRRKLFKDGSHYLKADLSGVTQLVEEKA
ncbi:Coq4 family protein [Kamptonema sp. UHCC 0994]|uniref:Coq4 family protein n=1 Tax=Kamptonema sp. UHCC 0994 TaxID=3031329 RepID=UPI0023B972BB|nr:Coq4 family protein [Kamptonema sp. UHCC 0994]MDF0552320.1 Coq4 family protein [Kamptonema sp. UHCC 0994]